MQYKYAAVIPDKELLACVCNCSDKDTGVLSASSKLKKLGPPRLQNAFKDWNELDGLLLYRGKVYVSKDITIRRDLIKLHPDATAVGHPGRYKTLKLSSQNYWWPGMTKFVHKYVDTCDICLRTKTFPAKPVGPLQWKATPEGPWQIVTSNLIVGLPKSQEFDSILVTAD